MVSQVQRTRALKTAGIVAALIFLIYFLSTSSSASSAAAASPEAVAVPVPAPPAPAPAADADGRPQTPPLATSPVGAATPSPPSPDGRKCTKAYDPNKPLIQYALMIDAGSTGSRIHVYRFNNCGPTPELEHEEFKMTEKKKGGSGLSSFKEDAEGAAKSLDPLMQVALDTVPEEYQSCSPVAVKATAGLRMLGQEMSQNILAAVRERLETVYPFPVVSKEKGGVEIMDGKDEGVYAWITTNYLLGKIGSPEKTPTAAIFDLGGGSTQIVFEPAFDAAKGEAMADGEHKYVLNFGGREFVLYQHSHLGYGLMAARQAVHKLIVETMHKENADDHSWLQKPIANPCIIPGMKTEVNVTLGEDHPLGHVVPVTMTGPVEASPASCRGLVAKVLNKTAECSLGPCSFNGVHQPSLEKTFATEDVFIFSYFYDRINPLGFPDSFTLRELNDLTANVCAGKENWGIFQGVEGALDELNGRGEYCLDLNFMLGLLHDGYEMPLSRQVRTAKKLNNNELGWCLGASLPLLSEESGWQCRVKQVA
ncbi:Guanosine-diphosphatase [Ascosphaera acerosa]|nr:Guanosine-diphosphatase [Ascosphaera acerosa]